VTERSKSYKLLTNVKVGELEEFARLRGQSDVQSRVQLVAFDNDEKIRSSFKLKWVLRIIVSWYGRTRRRK